jgi:hypothetical protein
MVKIGSTIKIILNRAVFQGGDGFPHTHGGLVAGIPAHKASNRGAANYLLKKPSTPFANLLIIIILTR